ncbi:MAG: VOC family protein [bacterium]|nr:VOC family protein [bacterium]
MAQRIGLVSLVVDDYDDALAFFVGKLGFSVAEDTVIAEQSKRWLVVTPAGASETRLLLARASDDEQRMRVGSQTGGRVFLFLYTDDFWRDYERYKANGVVFVREPKREPYGVVAVFEDLYGNLWDLLEPSDANRSA